MFLYEIKKYTGNKAFWLLALLGLVLKAVVSWNALTVRADFPKEIYRDYMDYLEGEPTEEKSDWILAEQARLWEVIGLHDTYEKMYQNGEMTLDEYIEKNEEYTYARAQQSAFDAVFEKYTYFQETDKRVEYFYDLEILQFFKASGGDFVLICFICFAVAMTRELENPADTKKLIRSMPLGRWPFNRCKLTGALLVGALGSLAGSFIDIGIYGYRYAFPYMNMPLNSIARISGIAYEVPVWVMFVLIPVIRLAHGLFITALVFLLAMLIQRFVLTIFAGVVIFSIPPLLADRIPTGLARFFVPNMTVNSWIAPYVLANLAVIPMVYLVCRRLSEKEGFAIPFL